MGRSSKAAIAGAGAARVAEAVVVIGASQFAPSSIQRFIAATSAAVRGSPRIGIGGASRPATWRYMRLCSALPGTSDGPCAPPSIADSRVRRSSFESFSVAP
jgi:hypothetical protein